MKIVCSSRQEVDSLYSEATVRRPGSSRVSLGLSCLRGQAGLDEHPAPSRWQLLAASPSGLPRYRRVGRAVAEIRSGACQPWVLRMWRASSLGSDNPPTPLINSINPPGDGEKRPPVTAAGTHIWPAKADAETNGETENARNVGQFGTWGNGDAVNRLRGKRCREKVWLLR